MEVRRLRMNVTLKQRVAEEATIDVNPVEDGYEWIVSIIDPTKDGDDGYFVTYDEGKTVSAREAIEQALQALLDL